jgi:hypothetical protein
MLRTLLHFRNFDSTQDLNSTLSGFFKRGIVTGGEVFPVPGVLAVDIAPFKLIGQDGMVVLETSNLTRVSVVAGQTNVVVFKSKYIPNSAPIAQFQVLELSAYQADPEIAYLTVFAILDLPPGITQVISSQIDYSSRDVIDAVCRMTLRGVLASTSFLPPIHNRPGDAYIINQNPPGLHVWDGVNWINITDTSALMALLTAHIQNARTNEKHLTDQEKEAAAGTSGSPSDTNRYVTDLDARIPTIFQTQALVGFPGSPSTINPFITSDYFLAQPQSKQFTAAQTVPYIELYPNDGPFFIGLEDVTSVKKYFKLYHATESREYVNSLGEAVTISAIQKTNGLPVDPLSDPTDNNGFYAGQLNLVLTGTVDLPVRVVYGQKKPFANILDPSKNLFKGSLLVPQPASAEMSQELLVRLKDISGRLFDDPMQTGESNVELKDSVDWLDLRFTQLKLIENTGNATRVNVTGVDVNMPDSKLEISVLKNLQINFSGCEIQFSGGSAGNIYESDGVTLLSTFAAVTPPVGEYQYYSVSLLPGSADSTNRLSLQVIVEAATAAGASLNAAPRASFIAGGCQIGQFAVHNNAGTVELAQILQNGIGSGYPGGILEAQPYDIPPADGFQAIVVEKFEQIPTDTNSGVKSTNATYDPLNQLYQISYDRTPTITTYGIDFTLSGAPSFELKVGDVVFAAGVIRKIVSVDPSQTAGQLDAVFSPDLFGAFCMLSQGVWTKDLVNYGKVSDGNLFSSIFGATTISKINVSYLDSKAAGDPVYDIQSTALVVCAASNSGLISDITDPNSTTYSPYYQRPYGMNQIYDYPLIENATSQRLHLAFFANPSIVPASGSCNLLEYQCSLYVDTLVYNGGLLNSAYCLSDGSGISNNCLPPTVVGGKTRLQLNFPYVLQSNPGQVGCDLEVYLDGKKIPRYYSGLTGAYWKEISTTTNTIEFHTDLSASATPIQVERRQGYNDSSLVNSLRLSAMADAIVGSTVQKASGLATHDSLQAAHDDTPSGGKILFLNQTIVENFNWTKSGITIEGKGYGSVLQGNLTMSASSCMALGFKVGGDINLAGSNDSFFRLWMGSSGTFTPGGGGNRVDIIAE